MEGDHRKILDLLFEIFLTIINHSDTRQNIMKLVEQRTNQYKRENILKRIFVDLGKQIGIVDNDSIVDKLISLANEFILNAKNDPNHVVNQEFDRLLISFANKLSNGKKDQFTIIDNVKKQLFDNPEVKKICLSLLINFKDRLIKEMQTPESIVVNSIGGFVNNVIDNIKESQSAQKKMDEWIKNGISSMITRYHKGIGVIIRRSLFKLSDGELAGQIKGKVGEDLQYIRLNGTVIGGIAGMVIYTIQSI